MHYRIQWRFFFRVKNQEKARGRLAKVSEAFNMPITPTTCEQYWKIPELYECAFATSALGDSVEGVVFKTLALAQTIGGPWVVKGPVVFEGGPIEFGGDLSVSQGQGHSQISGIEAVSFDLVPAAETDS